ncbi:hypothetical protein ABZ733_00930 [Streptomyces longwoodensis]|uniref:hypothetical protein n=1 Tax=Streptomyces longwoodensis TaxID=68231 RepID=UPI003400CEF2
MTKAPTPAHTADLTTRALTEARAMTGPGHPRPPRDGLAAAALRAHSALQAGYGRHVPLTALTPTGDAPHALAAFLAVYAAHVPHRPAPSTEPAPLAPPAPSTEPAPPAPPAPTASPTPAKAPAPLAAPVPAKAPPAPLAVPAPPGPPSSPARRPRQPAGRIRVPVPGAGCADSPSASAPLELRSSEGDLTVSRP